MGFVLVKISLSRVSSIESESLFDALSVSIIEALSIATEEGDGVALCLGQLHSTSDNRDRWVTWGFGIDPPDIGLNGSNPMKDIWGELDCEGSAHCAEDLAELILHVNTSQKQLVLFCAYFGRLLSVGAQITCTETYPCFLNSVWTHYPMSPWLRHRRLGTIERFPAYVTYLRLIALHVTWLWNWYLGLQQASLDA